MKFEPHSLRFLLSRARNVINKAQPAIFACFVAAAVAASSQAGKMIE